jgi:K+-sensing histidine kinase KdpD
VEVDPQFLESALMTLLQNAFEYTRPHGCVTLRARGEGGRAFVEIHAHNVPGKGCIFGIQLPVADPLGA